MACGTIRGCTTNKNYYYNEVVRIQIVHTGLLIKNVVAIH